MAGVEVGSGGRGGRKALDSQINMLPMIDLLMVTVAFLLITAVWVHSSRMEASAQVPGAQPSADPLSTEEPKLHVEARDPAKFVLSWRQGRSVVRSLDVPREATRGGTQAAFPGLAARVVDEWKVAGHHREAADRRADVAVVHAADDLPYRELVAIMDAVAEPKRPYAAAGKQVLGPAFTVSLASD